MMKFIDKILARSTPQYRRMSLFMFACAALIALGMYGWTVDVRAQTQMQTSTHSQTQAGGRELMSASTSKDVRGALFVPPIRHLGVPVKSNNLKEGASLPFVAALRQLAPDGWSAWEGNDLTSAVPATLQFVAGRVWYDALGDALFAQGLRADIDWTQKRIVLRSQPSQLLQSSQPSQQSQPALSQPSRLAAPMIGGVTSDPTMAAVPAAPSNRLPTSSGDRRAEAIPALNAGESVISGSAKLPKASQSNVAYTSGLMTPASPAVLPNLASNRAPQLGIATTDTTAGEDGPKRFELRPTDATIRRGLTRWAEASKWSLVYDAQNYTFDVPLEIEADFRDAVCVVIAAINKDIEDDARISAKKFVDAAFWPANRAVRVFTERADLVVSAPDGSCRRPSISASGSTGGLASPVSVSKPATKDSRVNSDAQRNADTSALVAAKGIQ